MSRFRLRIVSLSLAILTLLPNSLVFSQELFQLGNLSYARTPAPLLRTAVTRAPGFFRAVGGVAFEGVARGKDGIVVEDLKYDSRRPDGQRLVVNVRRPNGTTSSLSTNIFDWQLVPIARFANSDQGSAVTLFGALNDKQLNDDLINSGGRAINYHPALDNTLLGLRLLQADIMLFDGNATDLPKRLAGAYVLGAGEKSPDISMNLARFKHVQTFLDDQRKKGNRYRSYVVGDLDQGIMFTESGGSLTFVGRPFWTMWSYSAKVEEAFEDVSLFERASQNENQIMAQLAQMELKSRFATIEAVSSREKAIESILTQWSAQGRPMEINHALSKETSNVIARQDGINPVVYDALRQVMHYRGLFRHFRLINPNRYGTFVGSLTHLNVQPAVSTPTIQRQATTR